MTVPTPAPAMRRDVLVYLAGPLTARGGVSIETHVAAALDVFLDCLRRGIPAFCPHLSGACPSAWGVSWDTWLAYDCAVLDRCTHLLLLGGWALSPGACRERAYALAHGIPVLFDLSELPAAQPEAIRA